MRYRAGWAVLTAGYWALGSGMGACSAVEGQSKPSTTDDTQQEPTSSTDDTLTDSTDPTAETDDETTEGDPTEELTLGTEGAGCSVDEARACAGNNQRLPLLCSSGKWTRLDECGADERCDARQGHAGECSPVLDECAELAPGAAVPSCNGNPRQVCGPDLVTLDDAAACGAGEGCVDGSCEPTVPGCTAETEWVCDANGTERIKCGPNGTEAERMECPDGDSCVDGACDVPSCGGMIASCGPDENEQCCASSLVIGGTFFRGTEQDAPATISDFKLDVYEVTVGRFRKFKAAWDAGYRPNEGDGKHDHVRGGTGLLGPAQLDESGWNRDWEEFVDTGDVARLSGGDPAATWTSSPGDDENLPLNFINWYESLAFCIWDHGFLPSEAEWEYAATGGAEPDGERPYPWGATEPSCDYANYDACDGGVSIVGSRSPQGDGRFGHSDLAGSLYEWVLDFSTENYVSPCEDCSNLVESAQRVIRGGYWDLAAKDITTSSHSATNPLTRSNAIGARCAHAP